MRVTLRLTPPQAPPADTVSHPSRVDALGHPVLQDVPSLVFLVFPHDGTECALLLCPVGSPLPPRSPQLQLTLISRPGR